MESLMGFVLLLAAVSAAGLVAVCVAMAVAYAMLKDGIGSAVRAVERFFGPGCRIATRDHSIMVMQIVPVLELATACSEFSHGYRWARGNRKFLGIPVPFTSKEAECSHMCIAKAGFNFKSEYCAFEFRQSDEFSLTAFMRGKQYDVMVTIPGPVILSVETIDVSIVDRAGCLRFWAALTEADRNAIMTDMFPETRKHLERAGRPLLEEARNRLESGLRAIMPGCVRRIEFCWHDNPRAFDFEISDNKRKTLEDL